MNRSKLDRQDQIDRLYVLFKVFKIARKRRLIVYQVHKFKTILR